MTSPWAEAIGFSPHRDFVVVERMFGEVRFDTSSASFQFGRDGKPLYVAGPTGSPAQIRARLSHLSERFDDEMASTILCSLNPWRRVKCARSETVASFRS
jgi:hypothetical protein